MNIIKETPKILIASVELDDIAGIEDDSRDLHLIVISDDFEGELEAVMAQASQVCLQMDLEADNISLLERAQKIQSLNQINAAGIYFCSKDNIERFIPRNRKPALMCLGLASLLCLSLIISAYQRNSDLIKNPPSELIKTYDYYLQLKEERHWIKRLGFYKGKSFVNPIQNILVMILHEKFYKPISEELEAELSDSYLLFKLYLALHSSDLLDDDYLIKILSSKSNINEKLIRMYFELSSPSSRQLNHSLVRQARQELEKSSDAQNLYELIKALGTLQWKDIKLNDLIDSKELTSRYQIPGIFSLSAWYNFIEPEMSKRALESIETENEMRELYFNEYREAWFEMMKSIEAKGMVSAEQMDQLISEVLKNLRLWDPLISQEELDNYLKEVSQLESEIEHSYEFAKQYLNQDSRLTVPQSLRSLLLLPEKGIRQTLIAISEQQLKQQWDSQVYSYYIDHLQGKFPLSRTGPDVSMDAFIKFFAPLHNQQSTLFLLIFWGNR